jgi:hypothetical protein
MKPVALLAAHFQVDISINLEDLEKIIPFSTILYIK